MPPRVISIIFRLACAVPMPAQTAQAQTARAQTALAWKFAKGDTFAVEQHIVQATALEIKNKPLRQKSTLTLRTRWRVLSVENDAAKLTVVAESMASKVQAGDGKAVPSRDDEQWRGCEFTLIVDSRGKVRAVTGHEALLKKLAGGHPQRLKTLAALKPPESFQALFQDVLGPLPERPVAPGDRWRHTAVEAMSVFGSFTHTTEFTFRGQGRIDSSIKTAYQAPRYAIENDVFRIAKGGVKSSDGKGSVVFDAAKGRMQRVHKNIDVRGELTLETLSGVQRVPFTSETDVRIDVK
ncbi:MAG: hypothetical protein L0Y71_18755 [Gemmataceae bacterium]|nr:hypothetical protein [Gemmataceae bacterium]